MSGASLPVVTRLASLQEAFVVASVLRSAGIAAEVFDAQWGQNQWASQMALGGFRVVVPSDCLTDGADILRELGKETMASDDAIAGCVLPVWKKWLAAALILLIG